MIAIALKLIGAYLLGSINGSLVIGRALGVDIRREGSGNAGGTNALRTHGKWFALAVVIIDVLKAVVAVAWLPGLGSAAAPAAGATWLQVGCGAAAVAGHCYPAFFGFRGGKGMATLLGVYAALSPVILLVAIVTWVVFIGLFGYVGLATMAGAAAAPFYIVVAGTGPGSPLFVFALVMALFVIFTHRSNIARMRQGSESRMFRALLSRRQ